MIPQTQMRRQRAILGTGYTDFNHRLNLYARSRTNEKALADDLVQKTFLRTWAYLLRGGKIEMMEAFLYHILRALIIDEYRKRKTTSLDLMLEKGFDLAVDDTERLVDRFDGELVTKLIEELPKPYQQIIRLRYIQDLSLSEISLITRQTKNAVAVQSHRGLEKLKALYKLRSNQVRASKHI